MQIRLIPSIASEFGDHNFAFTPNARPSVAHHLTGDRARKNRQIDAGQTAAAHPVRCRRRVAPKDVPYRRGRRQIPWESSQ